MRRRSRERVVEPETVLLGELCCTPERVGSGIENRADRVKIVEAGRRPRSRSSRASAGERSPARSRSVRGSTLSTGPLDEPRATLAPLRLPTHRLRETTSRRALCRRERRSPSIAIGTDECSRVEAASPSEARPRPVNGSIEDLLIGPTELAQRRFFEQRTSTRSAPLRLKIDAREHVVRKRDHHLRHRSVWLTAIPAENLHLSELHAAVSLQHTMFHSRPVRQPARSTEEREPRSRIYESAGE